MKRRDVLRTAALTPLTLLGAGPVAAPTANAVDHYREAIKALPPWTDADRSIMGAMATTPLDRAAESVARRSEPAFEHLLRGAEAPACDWGGTWTVDGFDAGFALFGPVRDLARLAVLHSRRDVQAGQPDRGALAALAAITLGRHMIQGGILLAQLVGMAIEHVAIEAAAALLPALDDRGLGYAGRRFRSLPSIPDLAATIRAEKAFFLGSTVPGDRKRYDDAKVAEGVAFFDRMIAASATEGGLASLRGKGGPDLDPLLHNIEAYRRGRNYSEVTYALFLAAIAVASEGPGGIARVVDPTDGKPFDHRAWATGFELTSRFAFDKKPRASLVVGRR